MSKLTPDIATDVLAACRQNAGEIAEALSRVLDATATVQVGENATFEQDAVPADWSGSGLLIAMVVEGESAVAILGEGSGLLPEWYKNPDPTGESRLMTLAQEFGMLLLPEALMPDDSKAGRVANISESLARGAVAWPLAYVPVEVSIGDRKGALYVAWPIGKTADLFDAATPPDSADDAQSAAADAETAENVSYAPQFDGEDPFGNLPSYARSLLRIDLSVRVALAHKRQRADDIIGLGPGQIIQFNKSCDEMLDLMVGREHVAKGEAVKVGDKFGLRITSIVLPEERFSKVGS
ncbi:MAG: FliM/FliN family flagellar motor switch protein [Pirellulales bacterium]